MSSSPKFPTALVAVAIVQLGFGAWSAARLVLELATDRYSTSIDLLCIPVGIGLLKVVRCSREIAIALCVLAVIAVLAFAGVELFGVPFAVSFLGRASGEVSPFVVWPTCALFLLIHLWQLRVLTSSDVRTLFQRRRPREMLANKSMQADDASRRS